MSDTAWDEYLAETAAVVAPAVTGVDETSTPGEEAAPPEAVTAEADVPNDALTDPIASAASADDPAPEPDEEAPAFDWRQSPEAQAFLAQAEQDRLEAEQMRQVKARMAEAQRIAAEQRFQKSLTDIADGDPERMQQLTGLMAQATTPLQQQAQIASARVNDVEKAMTALTVALNAHLPEETINQIKAEYEALLTVDGPEAMERVAFGKRELSQQYQKTLSAKDAEIATLRKQLAAREELAQRAATGADAVDAGGGAAPDVDVRTRLAQAETWGDAEWSLFLNGRAA